MLNTCKHMYMCVCTKVQGTQLVTCGHILNNDPQCCYVN